MPQPLYRVVEVCADGSRQLVQSAASQRDAERILWLISEMAPRKSFQLEVETAEASGLQSLPPPRFATPRRAWPNASVPRPAN